MNDPDLLVTALTRPALAASFSLSEWDRCIPMLRHKRLLPRMCHLLEAVNLLASAPEMARNHLLAARAIGEEHKRILLWEINRVERALAETRCPMILLKGGAYAAARLPPARGRLNSDLDLLVPRNVLATVESVLLECGWQHKALDSYDERHYRRWMHEIPSLRHAERGTLLDVHHSILPLTSRLKPDPALLFESAVPLEGSTFRVLAPADMLLHSATHMFQDSEVVGSLRDLLDVDDLLRHFGARNGFWGSLAPRARQLDLARPLFYALRYAKGLLGTPVPEHVLREVTPAGPPAPILALMDSFVRRDFLRLKGRAGITELIVYFYVRLHWLRMPPLFLMSHLIHKAMKRMQ